MSAPAPAPKMARPALRLLLVVGGLLVWSSAFVTLYAGLSVGCQLGLDRHGLLGVDLVTLALVLLGLVHLAPLAWLLRRHGRMQADAAGDRTASFLARLGLVIAAIGAVATLWVAFPALILPPCL